MTKPKAIQPPPLPNQKNQSWTLVQSLQIDTEFIRQAHSFKIANRKFESTISIDRDDLSDDLLGIFKPAISEMGHLARQHPEELIFGQLAAGFTSECFDGQSYFDTDHPQTNSDGAQINVSKARGPQHRLRALIRPKPFANSLA